MALLVIEKLQQHFANDVFDHNSPCGNETVIINRSSLPEVAVFLRDDKELAFDMPIDCTAIDWLGKREPRFDVLWRLYSTKHHHRLCIKVQVSAEDTNVPSLSNIWRGMNWHERECFDMYGIHFVGHPNLQRILMYDEFIGNPLRKDYPIDRQQPLVPLREVQEVPTERNIPREEINQP
ncbi:MAG: NADH-quinone oxidoreductase subunit C [Deltaproteobacteria bacterium]|nr:NADH-quinone oxidoreductase subunit C [Deltaproteobacteria bacterium]